MSDSRFRVYIDIDTWVLVIQVAVIIMIKTPSRIGIDGMGWLLVISGWTTMIIICHHTGRESQAKVLTLSESGAMSTESTIVLIDLRQIEYRPTKNNFQKSYSTALST